MENNWQFFAPVLGNLFRYFIFAGLPFLVFYILFPEKFTTNKIQVKLAQYKDFVREILHSVQSSFVIGGIIALFLFTPLRSYTQIYENTADFSVWWIPLSILIALVVHDTYFYWMHRTVHKPALYKSVHLLHHKSVNPSPWASYSFHIFEAVAEALVIPFILCLIPMHPIALGVFGLMSFAINVYGHLGYEVMPRWFRSSWLFEVVNTSVYHNMHHEKFVGNYGLYFRVWDRLMKTENPNYVKEYDAIQARRFGETKAYTGEKISWPLVLLLGMGTFSATAQSAIEGQWKDDVGGAVINIYKENNQYFGQLISADDPHENEMIKGKTVVLMKNFEAKNDKEFCCGTIYQPKEKRTVTANLFLVDDRTLRLEGSYRGFTRNRIWTKL